MNVLIEAADIVARWERLNAQIFPLKRLPLSRIGLAVFTFQLRMAYGYIGGQHSQAYMHSGCPRTSFWFLINMHGTSVIQGTRINHVQTQSSRYQ
jgi:hypothetical protein